MSLQETARITVQLTLSADDGEIPTNEEIVRIFEQGQSFIGPFDTCVIAAEIIGRTGNRPS